jgi:hypothetical protein
MSIPRVVSQLALGLCLLGIAGCPPEVTIQDVDIAVTDAQTGRPVSGLRVRLLTPPELADEVPDYTSEDYTSEDYTSEWAGIYGGDALTSDKGIASPLLFLPYLSVSGDARPDRITGYIYGIEVESDDGLIERFVVEMLEGAKTEGSFFRIEVLEIR